jgi:hypothetical protein
VRVLVLRVCIGMSNKGGGRGISVGLQSLIATTLNEVFFRFEMVYNGGGGAVWVKCHCPNCGLQLAKF